MHLIMEVIFKSIAKGEEIQITLGIIPYILEETIGNEKEG